MEMHFCKVSFIIIEIEIISQKETMNWYGGKHMKKVLIFSNHPAYTYNLRKEIIEGFLTNNIKVTLVVPYGEQVEYFKKQGVKLVDIKIIERTVNPFKDLKLLWDNVKILKREKPDLVLTYATKQNIWGGVACRLTSTPYVPMITGLGTAMENPGLLQYIARFLYRQGIKKAQTLFVQNEAILNKIKQYKMVHSPTRMTPGSGVSLERHTFCDYPEKGTPCQFLFIGRIMRDKGIFELLEAAENIKLEHPEVKFKIIGHGDLEEDIEKVKSAERKGNVEYLGVQSDVRRFIRESHATILPSYHEGTANVLLESAAAGRPVLASLVPGCQETFDDGKSGIGFQVKNASALTEAIKNFLALPYEKKQEMGRNGREKMEAEYDRQIIVEMYLDEIYKGSR